MLNDRRIIVHGSPNNPHQVIEKCNNRSSVLTPKDKKAFLASVKSDGVKSLFDSITNRLNAIKTEGDRLFGQGDQARAIEFYKWFVSEYQSRRKIFGDLGDTGYSDIRTRLEELEKEAKP